MEMNDMKSARMKLKSIMKQIRDEDRNIEKIKRIKERLEEDRNDVIREIIRTENLLGEGMWILRSTSAPKDSLYIDGKFADFPRLKKLMSNIEPEDKSVVSFPIDDMEIWNVIDRFTLMFKNEKLFDDFIDRYHARVDVAEDMGSNLEYLKEKANRYLGLISKYGKGNE